MNKRMSKLCTFILTLLSVMIMTGCGEVLRKNVNKRPDDDISKAIYETVGGNKVYYQGKYSYNSDEIVIYRYLVHDYEADNVLKDMVEAANAVMEEKETTEKKELLLREEISGRYDPVVSLRTYYEGEDGYELQFAPSGGRCCVSQRSPGAGKRSIVFMTLLFRLPQYNVWLPA